jgi:predicted N-acetyltransferase YhbS
MNIRPEAPGDEAAIRSVTRAAFASAAHASGTEHLIVASLRDARVLTLSLVADDDGAIVGHAAVSPVAIAEAAGTGWYGIGPVSVAPEHQRRGVGSALMRATIERMRERGARGCVLLGDPGYYRRFGFNAAAPLVLPGVPAEYFQALVFTERRPAGVVRYHQAFEVTA